MLSLKNNLLIIRGTKHISYIQIHFYKLYKEMVKLGEYLLGIYHSVPGMLAGTIMIKRNNSQTLPSRSFLEKD